MPGHRDVLFATIMRYRKTLMLSTDWTWFSPGRVVGQSYLATVAQVPISLYISLHSTQNIFASYTKLS